MSCTLVLCMHNFILMRKIWDTVKKLGHAFYANNFSVQERLSRESVYLCDCTKRGFLVRATWTRRKYLTYFVCNCTIRRSMYYQRRFMKRRETNGHRAVLNAYYAPFPLSPETLITLISTANLVAELMLFVLFLCQLTKPSTQRYEQAKHQLITSKARDHFQERAHWWRDARISLSHC